MCVYIYLYIYTHTPFPTNNTNIIPEVNFFFPNSKLVFSFQRSRATFTSLLSCSPSRCFSFRFPFPPPHASHLDVINNHHHFTFLSFLSFLDISPEKKRNKNKNNNFQLRFFRSLFIKLFCEREKKEKKKIEKKSSLPRRAFFSAMYTSNRPSSSLSFSLPNLITIIKFFLLLSSWSSPISAALICSQGRTLCCCFTLSFNQEVICEDHFGMCESDETEMCCEGIDVCLLFSLSFSFSYLLSSLFFSLLPPYGSHSISIMQAVESEGLKKPPPPFW